ncbi:MAG: leucyl aminopeptidase [bacterium]
MRCNCEVLDRSSVKSDLLCVPLFKGKKLDPQTKQVDQASGNQISNAIKRGVFNGSFDSQLRLVTSPNCPFKEVLLLGLGEVADYTVERLRQVAGLAGKAATAKHIESVAFVVPAGQFRQVGADLAARAIVEGVNLGSYFLDDLKSGERKRTKPARLTVLVPAQSDIVAGKQGLRTGLTVSDLQNRARDLTGMPANLLTPSILANEARRLGRKHGLRVQVYNRSQVEKWRMGAFLAVAKGSTEPLKFIRLDFTPKRRAAKHVVLVGKGITFDSGGISIKPTLDMHEMKQDMGGAAVVLCTAAALAQMKVPLKITALIPACENLPSGKAYRPGDVLTTCTGKTIEVISTDAEGRLILADALGFAQRLKPDYIIDVATLTGAVIYALGHTAAAMLGTAEDLIERLTRAAEVTGERIWRLPLWDDYEYLIESPVADIKNSGGRPAGTITASRLLKHFVGDYPWVHIDIAGMDLEFRGRQYTPRGASGYGVRLLTEMLTQLA